MAKIDFVREFDFEYAVLETVSPRIRRIIARNPGPFTAWGTGTYVIGHDKVAIIDPGPALAEHTAAILHALRGETIEQLLITHTHLDHSPAAAEIKRVTGATTHGFGPHGGVPGESGEEGADRDFIPDQRLEHGDVVIVAGKPIRAIHTPGHTSNHLCFALEDEHVLFTGDHVMGWSTTVITPPDGNMTAYVQSLESLLDRDDALYMPTHGPAITEPKSLVKGLIEHRHERSEAIRAVLSGGEKTIPEIVDAVYIDLDPRLKPAAARSAFAHLIELVDRGDIACDSLPNLDGRYRLKP